MGEKTSGMVYLHQFPRCTKGPNISPFCLKMETFLRMAKIDYEAIGSLTMGPKGKVPFIVLDGETVADSDFIIEFLIKRFNLTMNDHLDERQKAVAHAMEQMLEENTIWTLGYHMLNDRCLEDTPGLMFLNPGMLKSLAFKMYGSMRLSKNLHAQGMGRHSGDEVATIVRKDLGSVSALLGKNRYVMGDQVTAYDAAVFALLASFYYTAPLSLQYQLMNDEYNNLGDYVKRMREEFYPDWDELTLK
ncbi:failed axon connections homolog [Sycon ciliatum]|uniref:failed axon connections homolog n=1 Tax=Sycon ciliatum TaxID=27933 RepID=UPI0031F685E1